MCKYEITELSMPMELVLHYGGKEVQEELDEGSYHILEVVTGEGPIEEKVIHFGVQGVRVVYVGFNYH